MIKIALSGCCGKMGKRIALLAAQETGLKIVAALEDQGHPQIGMQLCQIVAGSSAEVLVTSDFNEIRKADLLVEFTNPVATIKHLAYAVKYKTPVVIGTTGLSTGQLRKIKQASGVIAIVFSPNMSYGVNLLFSLVKQAAEKLGQNYKVDIIEAHHIHKQDAPSGTAKYLSQLVQAAKHNKSGKVDIGSIREGEIVGDHQVRFDGPQDTLIIKHSAKTRDIFAQGALAAAKFLVKQKPGFYNMLDVVTRPKIEKQAKNKK